MLLSASDPGVETRESVSRTWAWLPLASAVLVWPALVAGIGAAAQAASSGATAIALRFVALAAALALPIAGVLTSSMRAASSRLRLWAQFAIVAPVLAVALRIPQLGLPPRATWLTIFGAVLVVSLVRTARGVHRGGERVRGTSPGTRLLRLHRWSAVVLASFAALHIGGHFTAFLSLELNLAVVDGLRVIYKQPVLEGLLLAALPVQVVTGLLLFRHGFDCTSGLFHRLQLASGVYLAAFLAAHSVATAVLFRNITFFGATGARNGVFADPIFMTYYVLGPAAVFVHVACGVRALLARRIGKARAERWALGTLGAGAIVCLCISLALAGVHVKNDRQAPAAARRPAPLHR